jgi:hypothetical protein
VTAAGTNLNSNRHPHGLKDISLAPKVNAGIHGRRKLSGVIKHNHNPFDASQQFLSFMAERRIQEIYIYLDSSNIERRVRTSLDKLPVPTNFRRTQIKPLKPSDIEHPNLPQSERSAATRTQQYVLNARNIHLQSQSQ